MNGTECEPTREPGCGYGSLCVRVFSAFSQSVVTKSSHDGLAPFASRFVGERSPPEPREPAKLLDRAVSFLHRLRTSHTPIRFTPFRNLALTCPTTFYETDWSLGDRTACLWFMCLIMHTYIPVARRNSAITLSDCLRNPVEYQWIQTRTSRWRSLDGF